MKLRKGIHTLWNFSQGYRRHLTAVTLCGTLRIGISLALVAACKHIIDVATHHIPGNLSTSLLLMAGCLLLQLLLSGMNSRLYVHTHISLINRLRNQLLTHILKSRWTGREIYHSGDMMNRMKQDVDTVISLLSSSFPSLLTTLLQLVGATLFLLYLDTRMALLILFIMPLALLFSKIYMLRMRKLTQAIRNTDSQVQVHMQENLQHRTLIAALERTSTAIGTLGFLQSDLKRLVMQRNSFSIFSSMAVQAGFSLGYLTAFTWGVYGLSNGSVTFGMLTAFLQLVSQVQRPIVDFSRQLPVFINAWTSLERIDDLLSLPLEEQGAPVQLSGPIGIRLQQVTFTYPQGRRHILHEFTHDFTPGSMTAILGETGSGKSTLIRLMLALLLPASGRLTLYTRDTEAPASPLTRSNFIYVPQGNTLVSGTIRQNLLLGNPEASDAQLYEALHTATADFVHDLPQGLDTPCGESGAGLSEGQAQRIAIARGLLRPGHILLLDEPTSALDSQTAQTLLQRLSGKLQDKTLILITHQPQAAQLCQHVVHLKREQSGA